MNIGIIVNQYKDKNYEVTHNIIKYLNEKKIIPFTTFRVSATDIMYKFVSEDEIYKEINFMIVVGGDGTLLSVSYPCAKNEIPILAINMGTLGYLANVEKDEIYEALDKLLKDEYTIDERIMIESSFYKDEKKIKKVALNDFVVTKGINSKVVSLDVTINNNHLGIIRGDGLIVSTPTGSTAYNLTAMGPVLDPRADVLVVTPICPQTYSKPIVIASDEEVYIKVSYRSVEDVALSCDGQVVKYIENDETIVIKKSAEKVKLIKIYDKSFYDVFRTKLMVF